MEQLQSVFATPEDCAAWKFRTAARTTRGRGISWHQDAGDYLCVLYGDEHPLITEFTPISQDNRQKCAIDPVRRYKDVVLVDNTRALHRMPPEARGLVNPMVRIWAKCEDYNIPEAMDVEVTLYKGSLKLKGYSVKRGDVWTANKLFGNYDAEVPAEGLMAGMTQTVRSWFSL